MRHEVRGTRLACAMLFFASIGVASAVETTSWPPPGGVAARMRDLQAVIANPQSTPAQREAAREELSGLLKSPAGQSRGRTPDEKPVHAPRAAIEPLGPVVKPALNPSIPVPGVATMEITIPPRITVSPTTGVAVAPAGRAAIDPRTGSVLHDAGNGFIDPRTGQFTPK
jgi:hypothetical protein